MRRTSLLVLLVIAEDAGEFLAQLSFFPGFAGRAAGRACGLAGGSVAQGRVIKAGDFGDAAAALRGRSRSKAGDR